MEQKLTDPQYLIDAPTYNIVGSKHERMMEIKTDNASINNDSIYRLQLKNTNDWVNLSKSFLEVKFRLLKGANVALASDDKATLQNHMLSLFNRATLRVGNTMVEDINELDLANMFKSLLHYSDDYARSSGSNALFHKDTSTGTAEDLEFATTPDEGFTSRKVAYNAGYATRLDLTSESRYVNCSVKLSELFGFCGVNKVLKNCDVVVELFKNDADTCIHTASLTNVKVDMDRISMWVQVVEPSVETELGLNSQMANGLKSMFNYPSFSCYTSSTIASASSGRQTFRINTQAEKPLYCFLMCRNSAQTQTANSYVSNVKMSDAHIRVNGTQFPDQEYSTTIANNTYSDYSRVYADLVSYMNKDADYSNGISVSRNEWSNLHSIFAFDLTSLPENITNSPISLEARFTLVSGGDDCVLSACVVSEKEVMVSYRGSSAVVSQE